jgi:oligopeptide transport system ATP-binding protein
VTVQAGILRLRDSLRKETGLSVILITHDLGVMSSIADSVSVFYAGRIVEAGTTAEVLGSPRHPYTRALLDALPHPEGSAERELVAIAGAPPTPASRPGGCAFHPRCAYMKPSCVEHVPELRPIGGGRLLACPIDPFARP